MNINHNDYGQILDYIMAAMQAMVFELFRCQ